VLTGGPALAIDMAQNNSYRAINHAWKQNATVSFVPASGAGSASLRGRGPPASAQTAMVDARARREGKRRGPAHDQAAHQPFNRDRQHG
jgi:hypothetical protein